jgi:hypothetical protein
MARVSGTLTRRAVLRLTPLMFIPPMTRGRNPPPSASLPASAPMTDLMICGDSIAAQFYGWATQYGTARGYTYNNPPWINFGTSNSPAISGSTLMDYPGTVGFIANFNNRCGNYCLPTTRVVLAVGVNDFYAMAANLARTGGSVPDLQDWRAAWGQLNSLFVGLGANKPSVVVLGLPYITGSGIVRAAMNVQMRGDWMTARALMDRITARACVEYGWTFVTIRGQTPEMMFDTRHPNTLGQTYYGNQLIALA